MTILSFFFKAYSMNAFVSVNGLISFIYELSRLAIDI